MSYEDAARRETDAFKALQRAAVQRSHLDANAAIFSSHPEAYEAAVEELLTAVQAYQAASSDLLKARAARPR
jgi:hypothetical protein